MNFRIHYRQIDIQERKTNLGEYHSCCGTAVAFKESVLHGPLLISASGPLRRMPLQLLMGSPSPVFDWSRQCTLMQKACSLTAQHMNKCDTVHLRMDILLFNFSWYESMKKLQRYGFCKIK